MAMNWHTFRIRTISAIVFVAVMLTGLCWNAWSFLLLFSVIHVGCWWEYQRLMMQIDSSYAEINPLHRIGIILAGWGFMLFLSGRWELSSSIQPGYIGRQFLIAGIVLVMISDAKQLLSGRLRPLGYSLFGFVYISLSIALLLHIRSGLVWLTRGSTGFATIISEITGIYVILFIIAVIWVNDTMAYVVGSLIGKTPLSKVSPKKTWEGTIGGILMSVLLAWLTGHFLIQKGYGWKWGGIALVIAITGTVGDLFESKLKRMAGVKDSGAILPGHGGFLDRFDSLLLAAPAVWIVLKLIG
jgi:phosphatidate cytidylyltransferase